MSGSESEGDDEEFARENEELSGVSELATGSVGGEPDDWDSIEEEVEGDSTATPTPDNDPSDQSSSASGTTETVPPEESEEDAAEAEDESDADEDDPDDFPPVRDWDSRSFRINPEDYPRFRQRWREFRDAYDDEYMAEPNKTATFYNALILSALTDTPLDDILDEVVEKRVEHVTSETIDCVSFDD